MLLFFDENQKYFTKKDRFILKCKNNKKETENDNEFKNRKGEKISELLKKI